jgi:hypothetical protein
VRPLRTSISAASLLFVFAADLLAQSPTTGRIEARVIDPTGLVVATAEVIATNRQTDEKRVITASPDGNYVFPFLSPGSYRVEFRAPGFSPVRVDDVQLSVTETKTLNVHLSVAAVVADTITVLGEALQRNGSQRGVVDSEMITQLPLGSRNFTHILATSTGTTVGLTDNKALGRNSQNVSVDGARAAQNDYQLNGIDANKIDNNSAAYLAIPSPETMEFKLQISPFDAAFGRGGGGSVQTITRSGGNTFHGSLYDYFRNEVFNANDPFLKAAQVPRPILRRNVLGLLAGGPVRKDRTFFFGSYQATRERNAASSNSLIDVPIIQGLTDDRSEGTLMATFNLRANSLSTPAIHSVSLALLNAKLPNGRFVIPTPQIGNRYVGSEVSTSREDQFNINLDRELGAADRLSTKFFYSDSPDFRALDNANVPGFGTDVKQGNQLLSIQFVHTFDTHTINEARAGYDVIRQDGFGRQPVRDVDLGIRRANAAAYPGLGLMQIGLLRIGSKEEGLRIDNLSFTLGDTISMSRGKHDIRIGGSAVIYRSDFSLDSTTHGIMTFQDFNSFLIGNASSSSIGAGINTRQMRLADHSFFIQDDWAPSPGLTVNLGLRYELFLPPFEKNGAIATFDPDLYKPNMAVDVGTGLPIGPPAAGFVQAGNVGPSLDNPEIPNVGKRVVKSIDPNNFAPRVGFAYVPRFSTRLAVRGGYGIFYSRLAAGYFGSTFTSPPFFALAGSPIGVTVSIKDPYYQLPSQDQFPTFVKGVLLAGATFDRGIRTPYFHQYNVSVQWGLPEHLQFEAAYVGSRGLDLLNKKAINQARLASPQQPITNAVTGQVITTNSPGNAVLRTPYQGVDSARLLQFQSSGQSTYNSLQMSLTHQKFKGLQLLASYTYSKSLDNSAGGSGGSGDVGDNGAGGGNQLDPRANRGLSSFDRTHRFIMSYVWRLPGNTGFRTPVLRGVFSNWQLSGIVSAMSGLPIDIVDIGAKGAGSFYGLNGGNLAQRPNWSAGATRKTALTNIPPGYFFNPFAFARPIVQAGQPIPSSHGQAIASEVGTDFGNVGRNVLRGPAQRNVDIAVTRRFPFHQSNTVEFRVECFNLFNQVNFDVGSPVSNLENGSTISNTGAIVAPGNFGRILSTSNNPRLLQFALKLHW